MQRATFLTSMACARCGVCARVFVVNLYSVGKCFFERSPTHSHPPTHPPTVPAPVFTPNPSSCPLRPRSQFCFCLCGFLLSYLGILSDIPSDLGRVPAVPAPHRASRGAVLSGCRPMPPTGGRAHSPHLTLFAAAQLHAGYSCRDGRGSKRPRAPTAPVSPAKGAPSHHHRNTV